MGESHPVFVNAGRIGLATFVATAVALLVSAGAPRAQEPKKGGSVSISMESDLPTLDPLGFASFNDRNAGLLLYDTLLDIDAKGNVIPNIAERIDASEDVTSFKLTLRSGVKFSDGTAYDAAAVVKNFQRIMDPKNRCRCVSDLSTIASLEATGPLEVVIKMKSPSAHFPAALADVAGMVVSPAAVEKYGADFGNHGVGAGPFKLKEWRRGAQVIFERNPDYWRKPPYLDEVVLRPMPDEQTRYASLKAGNLDIVTNAAARDRVDAAQEKRFQILNPGSLATSFIQVNMGAPDVSDIRVRQALAYALDRVALNRALNRGLYKIANTPFGTGLFPHEAVDGYPAYDPAKAKKLVEEYGKPIKIKLSINASPVNALAGQALQQMWKKVGIETEIIPLEQVQLVRTAASRDYQVMLYRWAGGADPDKNVHQFFHSKGTVNRVNFNNPEMDKLLDAARATTNKEERLKIYRSVNNLLAKELPYLFLWYFDNVALANPAVKGLTPVPDGLLRMHAVWKDK
ncbi:ABC transporter substrate-binding protein [Bradyrhizobium sp. LHD-71]|uniref:ABC transporter substrate-binding protein n=1 Tax=Bradyrhizobium sp. LHD-71 TaxID=3072141 RepID=UPI0028106A44|nr:ABC transporter substrate-binding protein [Bradyrhizobium sp. LHD-71]MDQ8731006.1 ABC transporter substrate-binding protein [Bradyrhizobium sp. LHD-71]